MSSRSKKGSVLLYVIMIFCLMTILGLGLITLTNHNTKMTKIEMDSEQVYQSALSGLETTLVSFEKDPATGAKITEFIRSGGGTTSAELNIDKMGKINIAITCASGEEVSSCKKLKVDSTATLNGLSRTVTGYLNVIEGGLEFPVTVKQGDDDIDDRYRKVQQPGDKEYCLFGTSPTQVGTDCFKEKASTYEDKFSQYEKEPNLEKYNKKLDEFQLMAKGQKCNFEATIDSSCVVEGSGNTVTGKNVVIDNSKSDVVIDFKNIGSVMSSDFTLTDPDSEYLVIFISNKPLVFFDTSFGNDIKDADNFVIIGSKNTNFLFQGMDKNVNWYGWIISPFEDEDPWGALDTKKGQVSLRGQNNKTANLYGGAYASIVSQVNAANIYGVKPSDKMLGLFADLDLEMSGGGAMTFAKTYDK